MLLIFYNLPHLRGWKQCLKEDETLTEWKEIRWKSERRVPLISPFCPHSFPFPCCPSFSSLHLLSSLSLIYLIPTEQDNSADQEEQTQLNLDMMWQDDCQWYAYRWGEGLAVCTVVVSSCKVKRAQKSQEVSRLRFVQMDAEVAQDYRWSAILWEVTDTHDAAAVMSWGGLFLHGIHKAPSVEAYWLWGTKYKNFWREKTKDIASFGFWVYLKGFMTHQTMGPYKP